MDSMNENDVTYEQSLAQLKAAIDTADAILVGAGAGLSTAAGFTYAGERFHQHFGDFEAKYNFHDMYSGGFYPYETLEEQWAFWARYIMINRYTPAPQDTYQKLLEIVRDKNYFVITTNVDHQFQATGFSKERLFYTQGDYGLWQCSEPCHDSTYDNEDAVRAMYHVRTRTRHAHSPRACSPLPTLRQAHDHEPARRQYICQRRRLACSFAAVFRLRRRAPHRQSALPRAGSWLEYAGNHQVAILAHGLLQPRIHLRGSQPWGGRHAAGNRPT
jgi:hypothetical protein